VQVNPFPDPYLVAELLTKDETVSAFQFFGLASGQRSKKLKNIHRKLAAVLSIEDLSLRIRETLK
jgi:hypothetical protein